jgi:transcription-repair coupling factor (superfamily II helicase)
MPPEKLDRIMNAFYDGEYDVLLATNIVGSGLDVPSANTIFIHRADRFGLAQLYQLRGRVGRGKLRAYAYLTLPTRHRPSPIALKKLDVMHSLDSLGAGFTVASHDMDIRGFGNLLGDEQSGHVREVGIELYQEMLKEAIETAQMQQSGSQKDIAQTGFSPQINLGISVFIPDDYIKDLELRLGMYKRASMLKSQEDVEQFAIELIDRFGPLPAEVENLLSTLSIKQLCVKAGVDRLDSGDKALVLSFYQNQFKNPEALIAYISRNPLKTKIRADQKLVLMGNYSTLKDRVNAAKSALITIQDLMKEAA